MITSWREFYDALLRSPSHVIEGATLEQWLASPRGDFEAMARRLCGGALSKEISAFISSIYNPSGHERLKLAGEAFERIYGPGNTKTQATSTYYAAHTMSPRPLPLTAGELYTSLLSKGSTWAGALYAACVDGQMIRFICDADDFAQPEPQSSVYRFVDVLRKKMACQERAVCLRDFHKVVREAWQEFQHTQKLSIKDIVKCVLELYANDAPKLHDALALDAGCSFVAGRLGRSSDVSHLYDFNQAWSNAWRARKGEIGSYYGSLVEALVKGGVL